MSYSSCIHAKLERADCELPGVSSGPECPLQEQRTITPSSAPIAPVTSSLLNFYPDGAVGDRCDRQSLTQDRISQRNVHELGLDQLSPCPPLPGPCLQALNMFTRQSEN